VKSPNHNPNSATLEGIQKRLLQLSLITLFLCLVVLANIAVCLWWYLHPVEPDRTPVSIFQQVIEDAISASADDISRRLNPVRADNPLLIWRPEPDGAKRWLKVVSWMSNQAFNQYYADLVDNPEGGTTPPGTPRIWVTLAPEIQQFCQKLDLPDPSFRLKQYLGLDPNRSYQRFVELWVQPEDLFRPCPDPETDDRQCNLGFEPGVTPRVKNVDDYPAYFQSLETTQYRPDGAPWTRLGYTYDWAYGTRGIGASEFVMVPEARYLVAGSASTEDYCARH